MHALHAQSYLFTKISLFLACFLPPCLQHATQPSEASTHPQGPFDDETNAILDQGTEWMNDGGCLCEVVGV